MYRAGFVTIAGRPNTGKSTLLNRVIGQKVAITSDKPQTTRNAIRGIYTTDEYQIVFLDTPGMHKPRTRLGEYMMNSVYTAIDGTDCILFMIDASQGLRAEESELLEGLAQKEAPIIAVLNKKDIAKDAQLASIEAELGRSYPQIKRIRVSAATGEGIDALLNEVKAFLPEGEKYYDEEYYTDQTEREMVAEIIREKALLCLQDEVPHGIGVEIEMIKERNSELTDISAAIYCEKKSHKGIIIGKNGTMLKTIGSMARVEIEQLLGKKVCLKLWVKVRESWRNDPIQIKNLGYK